MRVARAIMNKSSLLKKSEFEYLFASKPDLLVNLFKWIFSPHQCMYYYMITHFCVLHILCAEFNKTVSKQITKLHNWGTGQMSLPQSLYEPHPPRKLDDGLSSNNTKIYRIYHPHKRSMWIKLAVLGSSICIVIIWQFVCFYTLFPSPSLSFCAEIILLPIVIIIDQQPGLTFGTEFNKEIKPYAMRLIKKIASLIH